MHNYERFEQDDVSYLVSEGGASPAADFAAYETTKQLVRTIGAEERAMRTSLGRPDRPG
jgi:hypothetical protein